VTPIRAKAVFLLCFFGFAIGAAVVLLARVGTHLLPESTYRIEADVPDAVALATAADVRQSGVRIGRVGEIRQVGQMIQLRLDIDSKYAPVYRNATTLVRAKSIAEENYVQLDPGTPAAGRLREGGRIPLSHNLEATQNDDVFSIVDRMRRQSLRHALDGLGTGLSGNGGRDLNRTVESMTALVDAGSPFARVLAEERASVARLVDSFGTVTAALGARADAIRTLTRSGKVAAEAVAARDRQLRAMITSLPPFLDQARVTADRLGSFSVNATPVIGDLGGAMSALVPVMRELPTAATQGKRALASLQRFANAGIPAFRRLPAFSRSLSYFVPHYEGFLRQLNPLVGYLDPYWREISTWFALAGAAVDNTDTVGHVARVLLPISQSSLPGTLPPALEALAKKATGGLDTRGSNAFPKPGTAAHPVPASGAYPRLRADPPYSR
jgi:phospholipid/cholesterol/gamma-HCH transport system substrate-binding protein